MPPERRRRPASEPSAASDQFISRGRTDPSILGHRLAPVHHELLRRIGGEL